MSYSQNCTVCSLSQWLCSLKETSPSRLGKVKIYMLILEEGFKEENVTILGTDSSRQYPTQVDMSWEQMPQTGQNQGLY